MKNNKKTIKSLQQGTKTYKCRNCYIIRFFLLAVVFIILLALIQSNNLHYLDFVTPTNAAILIMCLGAIIFLVKLTKYLFENKK